MIAQRRSFFRKLVSPSILGAAIVFGWFGGANAQSCQEDFQTLSARRNQQIGVVNQLAKGGKGKIDPIAACPALRRLVAIENEMLSYMEKNKDWCNIPENALEGFKEGHAKDQKFAAQACAAAAQAKKMQEAQQAGGPMMQPQKLPSGPL
jgi:hypothetical protein